MKFVLIAVFVTGGVNGWPAKGFSFQEFDSKQSCETAVETAGEMAKKVIGGDENRYQLKCIPK